MPCIHSHFKFNFMLQLHVNQNFNNFVMKCRALQQWHPQWKIPARWAKKCPEYCALNTKQSLARKGISPEFEVPKEGGRHPKASRTLLCSGQLLSRLRLSLSLQDPTYIWYNMIDFKLYLITCKCIMCFNENFNLTEMLG